MKNKIAVDDQSRKELTYEKYRRSLETMKWTGFTRQTPQSEVLSLAKELNNKDRSKLSARESKFLYIVHMYLLDIFMPKENRERLETSKNEVEINRFKRKLARRAS